MDNSSSQWSARDAGAALPVGVTEVALRPVTYYNSETPVLVGDYVEFKIGLFFWKGWQQGRVYYVPGVSPKNEALEFGGLAWVSIHDSHGMQTGHVVDPATGQLRRTVRFIRRSDDGLTGTPPGYAFREE